MDRLVAPVTGPRSGDEHPVAAFGREPLFCGSSRDKPSENADLIGQFRATQRTERYALSGTFSRHIVVFRSEIVLLYTDDWIDVVANVLKLGGPALGVAQSFASACAAPDRINDVIEQLKNADSVLAKFVRYLPNSGRIDAKLAGLNDLTPELLDEMFPTRISRLRLDRITSARLNLGPLAGAPKMVGAPAKVVVKLVMNHVPFGTSVVNVDALTHELIIKAVAPERIKGTGELWFRADRSQPLDEVTAMMREALGDRFSVNRYSLPPNWRPHLPEFEWR